MDAECQFARCSRLIQCALPLKHRKMLRMVFCNCAGTERRRAPPPVQRRRQPLRSCGAMGSHRLNGQQALYSALEALADASPRCYLKRTDGSLTLLQQLYDQCAAAGLVPAEAVDAIAQLHSLFDVMLEYGMGSAICDYIAEACSWLHLPLL